MLHFSKISTHGNEFNLIASGALAFKIHNKILKDEAFLQGAPIKWNALLGSTAERQTAVQQKKIFFVIISDLDKLKVESLCRMISKERASGGYAVCQVMPMFQTEPFYKSLKLLRQNFDEVIELNRILFSGSSTHMNAEQQQCIVTDHSVSMARIMFHASAGSLQSSRQMQETHEAVPVALYA